MASLLEDRPVKMLSFYFWGTLEDTEVAKWLCSNPVWTDENKFEQAAIVSLGQYFLWPRIPES